MREYPQFLSLKELVERRLSLERLAKPEVKPVKGKEVVDLTKWLPPVISESFVFALEGKPHLIPFIVGEKRMGGILGDIWEGIKKVGENVWSFVKDNKWLVIPAAAGAAAYAVSEDVREHPEYVLGPLGAYTLGYALYKWAKKPSEAVKQGVEEFYKYGYEGIPEGEAWYYKYGYEYPPGVEVTAPAPTPKPPAPETLQKTVASSPILKDLVQVGSDIAAAYIMTELQKKAAKEGLTSQQKTEQAMAYVTRWAPEFAKMGFQNMEQALAATTYAVAKGVPLDPNKPPQELLQIRPFVEGEEKPTESFLKKYWWALALGVVAIASKKPHQEGGGTAV